MTMRYTEYLRTFVLGLGVISSWSALAVQFQTFLGEYGTLLHGSTSLAANPLLTPCLYGSLAFLVALFWSAMLIVHPSGRSEVWLQRLLIFGIVFAAVVTTYDCAEYLGIFRVGVPIVCSPGQNPLYGACFRGLIFFALAYGAGVWQMRTRPAA